MKRDVEAYVIKCLICLQVKAEYEKPPGIMGINLDVGREVVMIRCG